MLYGKVKATITQHNLLEKGDTVICAVSGGADSMCLLSVMREMAAEFDIKVVAANLNHSLRGAEGDGDSQYVEAICEIKGIPFYGRKLDIGAIAKAKGISVEEAGREERYKFFDEIASSLGGAKIATGHNISDNAETVLFRLGRGSSAKGLCGIRYKRGNIIRPLLDVSRAEITQYLIENGIIWREDSTNAQLHYTRNKIRHSVLASFEKVQPGAVEKIVSCAKSLSEDEDYLSDLADKLIASARVEEDEYSTSALIAAPAPISKRAAAKLLEEWGAKDIDREKINSFLELCKKGSGKRMDINADSYILRSFYTVLRQCRENERKFSYSVKAGQKISHENWSVSFELTNTPPKENPKTAVFDAGQLFGTFTVRSRSDGDKIKLKGGGSKKLKELFIDMKIPQNRRSRIPVILKGDEVIFVPPLRKTPRYAPNENTKTYLVIKYSENTH